MDIHNLTNLFDNEKLSSFESIWIGLVSAKGIEDLESLMPDEINEVTAEATGITVHELLSMVNDKKYSIDKAESDKLIDSLNDEILFEIINNQTLLEHYKKIELEDLELHEELLEKEQSYFKNMLQMNERLNEIALQILKDNLVKIIMSQTMGFIAKKISAYDKIITSFDKVLVALDKALETAEKINEAIDEVQDKVSEFAIAVSEVIAEVSDASNRLSRVVQDDDAISIANLEIERVSSDVLDSLGEISQFADEIRDATPTRESIESMRTNILDRKSDILEKKNELEDIRNQLGLEDGNKPESIEVKGPVDVSEFILKMRNRLSEKSYDEDLDEDLLDEIEDDIDRMDDIRKSVQSITRKLTESKKDYIAACDDYKQFCDRVAETARSEGRTVLSASEREQLQSHVDSFKKAKDDINTLKVEMADNLNRMSSISEKYKDDMKDLDMAVVIEPWKQKNADISENLVQNTSISFSGGHRAQGRPFLPEEQPGISPNIEPDAPKPTSTKPKSSNSGSS